MKKIKTEEKFLKDVLSDLECSATGMLTCDFDEVEIELDDLIKKIKERLKELKELKKLR